MKRIRGVALTLLFVLMLLCLGAIVSINSKTYNEEKKTVVFNSDGQKIHGRYVQGDLRLEKGIVLLHDEGKDKTSMTAMASAFNKEGYTVFYYDIPGHGESEGVFNSSLYTNGYLESTLDKAIDKMVTISGIEAKDIALFGDGLGARTVLKYAKTEQSGQDLYLIMPFTARSDADLISDDLMRVGEKHSVLVLYSALLPEYKDYLAPALFKGLTNEQLKSSQSRNINLAGSVEFNKLDYAIPGLEQSSNAYIKKVVFKAATNNGTEVKDDYFNTRTLLYFLTLFSLIAIVYFLSKAFAPSLRVNKKQKRPYGFGLTRLLMSIFVIAAYLAFRYFYADRMIYNIKPFYDEVLVVFAAYIITGLHELKYRKVIHTGDTALGGGMAFFVGFLISAGIVFWALSGFTSFEVFKNKWFYLLVSTVLAWLAFYIYALEYGVTYMKGATKRLQRYLIRLVFLIPFIVMFILAYLDSANDLYRLGLQLGLIGFCLCFAEGLQRLGNNMPVSAFFPALLYSFMTITFSVMI